MAKWRGKVGYAVTVETSPGVWKNQDEEKVYSGDIIRNGNRWSASSDSTNDDISLNNQLSIVADPFAYQNFHSLKWAEFMGTKWKISNVEVQYPRLILTLGGRYNG